VLLFAASNALAVKPTLPMSAGVKLTACVYGARSFGADQRRAAVELDLGDAGEVVRRRGQRRRARRA
jgi:hypothetical protein